MNNHDAFEAIILAYYGTSVYTVIYAVPKHSQCIVIAIIHYEAFYCNV